MNRFYKILRAIIVTAIAIAVTVPAVIYVGLSLPSVQRHIAGRTERELSNLLGADVTIGSLTVAPFNRAMLRDVTVTLDNGRDTVLTVDRLGAGINLYELTANGEIVVNYVELIGLDMRLSRDSTGAPLNIDPIIARLSPADSNKPKKHINLAVNTVILRDSKLAYDVDSIPARTDGQFSPHHAHVFDLSADLRLPTVGSDGQVIKIKRFKARETSGLEIVNLTGDFTIMPDSLGWSGLSITLPRSEIAFTDFMLPNAGHLKTDSLMLTSPLSVSLAPGSHITPVDLAPLCPALSPYTEPVTLRLSADGTIAGDSHISFSARTPSRDADISASARFHAPLDSISRALRDLRVTGHVSASLLDRMPSLPGKVAAMIEKAGYADFVIGGSASNNAAAVTADLTTDRGSISANASVRELAGRSPAYEAEVTAENLEAGTLLDNADLGIVEFSATASGRLVGRRHPEGLAEVDIERLDWRGHTLGDIDASLATSGNGYDFRITSLDPAAKFNIEAGGTIDRDYRSMRLASVFDRIDIDELLPGNRYSDCTLRLRVDADLAGAGVDDMSGNVSINDLQLIRPDGRDLALNGITVTVADEPDGKRSVKLASDIMSGEAYGDIYFSSIGKQILSLALESLPAVAPEQADLAGNRLNDFTYEFTLHDTEPWADALRLPVSNLGSSTIKGAVDYPAGSLSFDFDARYLRQGNKLIEHTQLQAFVDGKTQRSKLYFTTQAPTKHGPLALDVNTDMADNRIGTDITWAIDRTARYDGNISLSAQLDGTPSKPHALVTLNPGNLTFNDSTWTINRATVDIAPGLVTIDGINAHRSGQFVKIDGRASHDPTDEIRIDLLGVNLDYIFESLGIDKVMLGGDATGRFYASSLFSPEPHLNTDGLSVRAISYNKVVLGDALIQSHWDGARRAITLDAVVDQENGLKTLIDGAIFPLNDSIDITFDAHEVDVAFMHPYMSAFASEVSGRASGVARLWGNFKYIDMEGDIAAHDVKLKIDFTKTTYSTSDTIRLRLGEITLKDMTIADMNGHTARLNGKVWHKYFKEPSFDFTVSDTRNLLVYDESSRENPDWYGRIYGNGTAHISGRPGVVDIKVDMTTAPSSTFTFVLNDMEEASDYTFITFRDRDVVALGEQEKLVDDTPSTVRRLREMLANHDESASSAYNIDLVMGINPDAQITLVMDPVGGDRIRSQGNGNLRMTYGSVDNELHMYGTYTLDRGNYNFTLQDIIIKNFTIKPGSSISFTGDPFSAILDISAAYGLTANLSDLDESFLQDKDLNRTTVPVNAILNVTGVLQQPDIKFDIEFPTLTQDTYRKVRSIVSTEEMMNRQIIYLLALSRFYTPDYMASATRGNELVSVASSTISSQLGNILGSISDNWNIAPSFRSDRDDFSDMEIDVALSSSLLNNRLLFNGNFGYRDKSLNNTQFVGDFDIEYLLNRTGSVRLKAYNRYNDMNYYVRTAETTQGVGVSFRRNFDNLSDLLRRHRRQQTDTVPTDSIKARPDSIPSAQ